MTCDPGVAKLIEKLGMQPHPEGGYFVETFRDNTSQGAVASTAIYYLLEQGDCSHWHRVHGSSEVWHYYAGAPLQLSISPDGGEISTSILGSDILGGERPQLIVPANHWQSARSLGEWTLVGCTVAPGFEFENFEMAPEGWVPGNAFG